MGKACHGSTRCVCVEMACCQCQHSDEPLSLPARHGQVSDSMLTLASVAHRCQYVAHLGCAARTCADGVQRGRSAQQLPTRGAQLTT